jgi:hypothetical protein
VGSSEEHDLRREVSEALYFWSPERGAEENTADRLFDKILEVRLFFGEQ